MCKITDKYQTCHVLFALYLLAKFIFYSLFELNLLNQQKRKRKNELIHNIHVSNSDADRKAEDRGRITLYTVSDFFRLFGSQHLPPCLPGSVPPRGVMVTAAAEAWVVTVEAER